MTIPRVLHFIWVGPPMPTELADNLQAWRDMHPGWGVHLWHDHDLHWLTHRDLYEAAHQLVPPDAVGQLRSDLARYEILRKMGGLYADCDTRPLRPVDDALAGLDAFAAAEDARWVGNTYLGCTPGHPVMADLVGGLRASVTTGARRRLRPNRMTGPRYLTPVWRRHGCHVAPAGQWFPYSYADVRRGTVPAEFGDGVYAVHQWRHTRDVLAARRARRA